MDSEDLLFDNFFKKPRIAMIKNTQKIVEESKSSYISFNKTSLHLLKVKHVIDLFESFPDRITTINLEASDIRFIKFADKKNIEDSLIPLITVCEKLPKNITAINFFANGITSCKTNEIIKLHNVLPKKVTHITFGDNNSDLTDEKKLAKVISRLPSQLTHFDLQIELFQFGVEGAVNVIKAIPKHINCIGLKHNQIYKLKVAGLVNVLKSLSQQVTQIDLSNNELYKLGAEDLSTVLAKLPNNIKHINLGSNYLDQAGVKGLTKIFKTLSKSVTRVDLNDNMLHRLGADNLVELLKKLPPQIKQLGLSNNKLYKFTENDLAKMFKSSINVVEQIDLSNNQLFFTKKQKEIDSLLNTLNNKLEGKIRLLFNNNGEAAIARVLLPMLSLIKKNKEFNSDIIFKILSFIVPNPNNWNAQKLIEQNIKSAINDNKFLVQHYKKERSKWFHQVKLSRSKNKLELLKKWSDENPNGAAGKTLDHFCLRN